MVWSDSDLYRARVQTKNWQRSALVLMSSVICIFSRLVFLLVNWPQQTVLFERIIIPTRLFCLCYLPYWNIFNWSSLIFHNQRLLCGGKCLCLFFFYPGHCNNKNLKTLKLGELSLTLREQVKSQLSVLHACFFWTNGRARDSPVERASQFSRHKGVTLDNGPEEPTELSPRK